MSTNLMKRYIRIYLCILGGFLFLMIPIYMAMYKGTEKLILTERYNDLIQEVTYLDEQIGRMVNVKEMLADNVSVKKVAGIQGEPATSDAMEMRSVEKLFTNCFYLSGEGYSPYLIFRENPIVIARKEILSSINKQDYKAYGMEGMTFTEFQEMVFGNERQFQYILEEKNGVEGDIIGILKTLSDTRFFCDTAIVFRLDREMLHQVFSMEGQQQTDFAYIMDRYGEVLYRNNYNAEPLEAQYDEGERIIVDGKKHAVFQVVAENSGLIFTLGISDVTIRQSITDVSRIIMIYITIAVLGMIVFCVLWARSRAKNMSSVLRELEVLKESISESLLEKLLLQGVYTMKERREIERYLHWEMEFYCVVCVSTRLEREEEILAAFCRTDEFFHEAFTAIALNTGQNERNYIVQLLEESVPDNGWVSEKLKELLDEVPEVAIGISATGIGLENIQLCYRQARLMNRQATDQYDSQMKVYHKPADIREKIFKLNLGNRIYDLINAQEKDTLYTLFGKIRSYAARTDWYTEAEIMQFFFEVQNPIAKIWDEIEPEDREKNVLSYQSDKTIAELIDSLEEISCYLCDCLSRNKENSKNAFRRKMIQFVEDNYTSKDMCVSYVAEHLGISDKYFAALFKEQTGKTFGVYVESRRMKRAEQYLRETDIGVARIAELVGYNTVDAFYKSFKKHYGVAPGKWKENNKK